MNHSINNNTLKSKKNKYLILIDRYKIEGLKKKGISNKDIGDQIGNDHELAKYIEDKIINGKQSPNVVIRRYPRINKITLRITSFVGFLFGILNMITWFILNTSFWWMGILHFPLLIISFVGLVLSKKHSSELYVEELF